MKTEVDTYWHTYLCIYLFHNGMQSYTMIFYLSYDLFLPVDHMNPHGSLWTSGHMEQIYIIELNEFTVLSNNLSDVLDCLCMYLLAFYDLPGWYSPKPWYQYRVVYWELSISFYLLNQKIKPWNFAAQIYGKYRA